MNYGTFQQTDERGEIQGSFRASEYALNLVFARSLPDSMLNVGANLKPIYSSFERYPSFGLALDLGIHYTFQRTLTSVGFVAKNMGAQLSTYTSVREKLPFELQLGVTQALAHARTFVRRTSILPACALLAAF